MKAANGNFNFEQLAKMLRKAKEKQGLTTSQLSDASGLTLPTIHRVFTAKSGLSIDTIVVACNFLNKKVQYFLTPKKANAKKDKVKSKNY